MDRDEYYAKLNYAANLLEHSSKFSDKLKKDKQALKSATVSPYKGPTSVIQEQEKQKKKSQMRKNYNEVSGVYKGPTSAIEEQNRQLQKKKSSKVNPYYGPTSVAEEKLKASKKDDYNKLSATAYKGPTSVQKDIKKQQALSNVSSYTGPTSNSNEQRKANVKEYYNNINANGGYKGPTSVADEKKKAISNQNAERNQKWAEKRATQRQVMEETGYKGPTSVKDAQNAQIAKQYAGYISNFANVYENDFDEYPEVTQKAMIEKFLDDYQGLKKSASKTSDEDAKKAVARYEGLFRQLYRKTQGHAYMDVK